MGFQNASNARRPEPTVKNLATVVPSIALAWAIGTGGAMAETCFETKLGLINQIIYFAANDTNAAVQYKVCLTAERTATADILNPSSALVTLESFPEGTETGCAFVTSNKSLAARLTAYEGSSSK